MVASSLATAVRQEGRQAGRQADRQAGGRQAGEILSYDNLLKIQYPDASRCFLVFNVVIDAKWSKTIL